MQHPTSCYVQYLTRLGWSTPQFVNLMDPERYVTRLESNGKVGRCTELDAEGQPTGLTWEARVIPDPNDIPPSILERLVDSDRGNPGIPRLKPEDEECEFCLGTICDGDGTCLL